MSPDLRTPLQPHLTPPARVQHTQQGGFVLAIPDGPTQCYRLAQLDDYHSLPRSRFMWREPVTLSLRVRVSNLHHSGTWGFGLWNDPFSVSLGLAGGMARRLPALPNAAWFFFASPENYLSFKSDKPAQGFLAQTFKAPNIPSVLLAPFVLGLPLLAFRPLAQWIRAVASRIIHEDSARISVDVTQWNEYRLRWSADGVDFAVNGNSLFSTEISPRDPLGLVIWIDNQYAAWRPDGSLDMGTLANSPAWLEITDIEITN